MGAKPPPPPLSPRTEYCIDVVWGQKPFQVKKVIFWLGAYCAKPCRNTLETFSLFDKTAILTGMASRIAYLVHLPFRKLSIGSSWMQWGRFQYTALSSFGLFNWLHSWWTIVQFSSSVRFRMRMLSRTSSLKVLVLCLSVCLSVCLTEKTVSPPVATRSLRSC